MLGPARGTHELVFRGPPCLEVAHLSSLSHGFCMFSGGLEGWHAGHSHGGIEQDLEENRLYHSNGETEAEDWRK